MEVEGKESMAPRGAGTGTFPIPAREFQFPILPDASYPGAPNIRGHGTQY